MHTHMHAHIPKHAHSFLQEPQEIKIGERYHVPVFSGSTKHLVEKQDTYQCVPLLPSLCLLLSDPSIFDDVEQCQYCIQNDGVVEDVCDGVVLRGHILFANYPFALQIIVFYDEFDLCNPLERHIRKHMLAITLFTQGNIHPKYRSCLKTIHLLMAATVHVIEKHGIHLVLQPFVWD